MDSSTYFDLPDGGKLPAVGYGTWQATDDSLEKGLEAALQAGYRHIDTAAAYENEDVIGKVLKRWFDAKKLKREDLFITTKLPALSLYADKVEECLKTSLQKLQLDYVDLYLLHFPVAFYINDEGQFVSGNTDHEALWKKMEEQVDAGRTKYIGVSNFTSKQIAKLINNSRIKPANSQVEIHVYMQQKEHVDFCHKNGVTVVAYAPVGSRGYAAFLKSRGLPAREIPDLFDNSVVIKIASKYNKTPAQILLKFLVQRGISVIPKSVTESRIIENIKIFDFTIDEADMEDLYALEIGPTARICDWGFTTGVDKHPEYPF